MNAVESGSNLDGLFDGKRQWAYKETAIPLGIHAINGDMLRVTAYEREASTPGPMIVVISGIHPDKENTGMVSSERAGLELSKYPLMRGKLLIIPIANTLAAYASSHVIPQTDEDLNRCFPGNPNGSVGEIMAFNLFGGIKRKILENAAKFKPDKEGGNTPLAIIVDEHNEEVSGFYLRRDWRLDDFGGDFSIEKVMSMEPTVDDYADSTGFTVVNEYPPNIYIARELDHSITGAINNDPELQSLNVRAYTIELGNSGIVDQAGVAAGSRCLLRLAVKLEMIDPIDVLNTIGASEPTRIATSHDNLLLVPNSILFDQRLRPDGIKMSGHPLFIVKPNQQVRKGEIIGELYSQTVLGSLPGGRPIKMAAPCDGCIMSLPIEAYFRGNDILTMAVKPQELKNLEALGLLKE